MSTTRRLADGADPFDVLPSAQMLEALATVAAMAHHDIANGNRFPLAVDEFNAGLESLRRRVISNEQACEWSDYRKASGVSQAALSEAHKAFIAGWEAGQGKRFEEGPLR